MTGTYILVIIVGILAMILAFLKPVIKGRAGESIVGLVLNKLPKEEYLSIHNLLLKTSRGTSQIDYVVVSIYGIFVIEVKNYTGWITGSEYGNQWTQTIYHSKHRFMNPIHQNYGHVKAVEKIVNDSSVPVYSIVAFSGDCELMADVEHSDVVLWGDLIDTIKKHSVRPVMDIVRRDEIVHLLNSKNIDSKETRKEHLKEIHVEQNQIRAGICPRCGGRLVVRHGKYGKFMGCSNYPKCRYTREIEE